MPRFNNAAAGAKSEGYGMYDFALGPVDTML